MLKIVYAVYHNVNQEARSMELLHCCCAIGSVEFVSYAIPEGVDDVNSHLIDKRSPIALFSFLGKAKEVLLSTNPDLVVLHDYDCSALIPFIKHRLPRAKIIYDSSELFIDEAFDSRRQGMLNDGVVVAIKEMLTSFRKKYEKRYLREVDLVFAANIERAQKMKEYFTLRELPRVFDNIHRIDDIYDEQACRLKFTPYIKEDKFNIIFAGGISNERETLEFIDAYLPLNDSFNLLIVGSASRVALKKYNELIEKTKAADRVHYLGYITRAELRYCFKQCDISVVIFDKDSFNTFYCASGKSYESLFEGTPILASTNPPLQRICSQHGVGLSTDDYAAGIMELKANYEMYAKNVNKYIESLDYDGRLQRMTSIMLEVI